MPKRNLPDWFPGLRAIDQMDQKEGGRRRRRGGRREVGDGGGGWKGKKDSREEQRRRREPEEICLPCKVRRWPSSHTAEHQTAGLEFQHSCHGEDGSSAKCNPVWRTQGCFLVFGFCFFLQHFPKAVVLITSPEHFAKPQWLKEDKYIIGSNGAFLQFSSHSHWWEWSGNDDSLTRGFVNYPPTGR